MGLKDGTCVQCKLPKKLAARGLCCNCYAKSRKAAGGPALPSVKKAKPAQDSEAEFAAFIVLVGQWIELGLAIEKKFSDIKMKFIVTGHQRFKKNVTLVKARLRAALTELPVVAAEDAPEELNFDR